MTVSLDDTYALLSARRRRYALARLLDAEFETVDGLAARVAAWEEGTTIEEVPDGTRREVQVTLVHDHLPRLADHGIVEYDARSGDVVRADRFEELRPAVEDAASRIERCRTVPVR